MNIHPLFVHFPLGLLIVYALLEVASLFPRFRRIESLSTVKAFLAIAGGVFAYITAFFGEMAEEALNPSGPLAALIGTHSMFAYSTIAVFSLLAGAYLVRFISASRVGANPIFTLPVIKPAWRFLTALSQFILFPQIAAVLALGGLVLITITGGLGASIVYGPNFDPFVHFIYGTFFRG
jgi:uncharacterized membrane protein